jgi:uncharacterized delta-60 repeat protein
MLKNVICVRFFLVVVLFAIQLFQTSEAKAAWGDFDTSFGSQGVAIDTVSGYFPRSVAIQPDGKILVTGYRLPTTGGKGFFLRRYLSNGQLDTAFGSRGAAVSPETVTINSDYRGERIVVQTNGKIAVAGWANGSYAVWQFGSNGRNDTAFGQNGLKILTGYPVSGSVQPEINIQSEKILLSLPKPDGDARRLVLVRLTSSGAFDQTFGNSGEVSTNKIGGPSGTVVERNGAITVGGNRFDDPYSKALERKSADGQVDPSFFPTSAPWDGTLRPGLVKLSNGKYVLSNYNIAAYGMALYVDKFSSNGFFESSNYIYYVMVTNNCPVVFANQTDGKLLLEFSGTLFRLNAELDSGTMEINPCSNLSGITDWARAAVQTNDRLVAAGISNNNLILVRLLPN